MTAFLFIPTSSDGKLARRVDFGNIASLFADVDEPATHARSNNTMTRVLALLMIVIFAVGDTVLVARPYALTHALPQQGASADARAITNL